MTLIRKIVAPSIGGVVRHPRSGSSSANPLALNALTYNPTTFAMLGIARGVNGLTSDRASSRYVEDHEGVYQLITANNPAWYGARYSAGVAYADDGTGTLLDPLPLLDHNPWSTNSQIRSNDLADAEWTAVNMTVGDQDAVGLTGVAWTACTLTATAANATLISNTITAASSTHAAKWYVTRAAGTGAVELTIDGGATWQAITASLDADFAPGIAVDQAAVTNPQIGIRIATSGDSVIVGNAECYLTRTVAKVRNLGPIFTTTSSVVKVTDNYFVDVENHNNSEVCYYIEWSPGYNYDEKATHELILTLNNGNGLLYDHSTVGRITTYANPNLVSIAGLTYSAGDILRIGVIASDTDDSMRLNINGAWAAAKTYSEYTVTITALKLLTSAYPMRMRNLQRWSLTGAAAQVEKINELMA